MAGRPPHETTDVMPYGVESRRLRPPASLGELQKRVFVELVTSCPVSQFRRSDVGLLCRWSELTVMAEQAARELEQGGMVVTGQHGPKTSPWFSIYRDAVRELRSLSQRLQLGPRGRTPRAPKTLAARTSYYDVMDLVEGGHDDAN